LINKIKYGYVLVGIFIINALQSYYTELHPDEAYYWAMSQNLQWGYFHNPPMVAAWIKLGYALIPNALGVRLLHNLALLGVLWLSYRLIFKKNTQYLTQYLLAALALPLLQVYGFIATPDMPLLLFGLIFLYFFNQFLQEYSLKNALLLGIFTGLLIYCKYHGVLIVLFAVIAHLSIFKKKYTYLAALSALLIIMPHLYWQFSNDFPTFKFQLMQRHKGFQFKRIPEYFLGQWLVFNPLWVVGIIYLYAKKSITLRISDDFERILAYISVGFVAFFLIMTYKGRIDAHYTAFATLTALMFLFKKIAGNFPKMLQNFTVLSLVFICVGRLCLVFDILPNRYVKVNFFEKKRYETLFIAAQKLPVLFVNSYQNTSKYKFYYDKNTYSLNTQLNVKNYYDFTDYESTLRHSKVVIAQEPGAWGLLQGATTSDGNFKYLVVDSLGVYPKLHIEILDNIAQLAAPPARNSVRVRLYNPYDYAITITPDFAANITLWQQPQGAMRDVPLSLNINTLAPKTTLTTTAQFVLFDEIIVHKKYNYTVGFKPKYCIALCASEIKTVEIK
jgi:hypothetical protein